MTTRMAAAYTLHLWTLLLSHLSLDFFQISYMSYFYQTLARS